MTMVYPFTKKHLAIAYSFTEGKNGSLSKDIHVQSQQRSGNNFTQRQTHSKQAKRGRVELPGGTTPMTSGGLSQPCLSMRRWLDGTKRAIEETMARMARVATRIEGKAQKRNLCEQIQKIIWKMTHVEIITCPNNMHEVVKCWPPSTT